MFPKQLKLLYSQYSHSDCGYMSRIYSFKTDIWDGKYKHLIAKYTTTHENTFHKFLGFLS